MGLKPGWYPLSYLNAVAMIEFAKMGISLTKSIMRVTDEMLRKFVTSRPVLDLTAKSYIKKYDGEDDPIREEYRNCNDFNEALLNCANTWVEFFKAEKEFIESLIEWASYEVGNSIFDIGKTFKKINFNSNKVIPAEALLYRIMWKKWIPAVERLGELHVSQSLGDKELEELYNGLIMGSNADIYIMLFRERVNIWRKMAETGNVSALKECLANMADII